MEVMLMFRRDFIRIGGLSFGGLNLERLLAVEKERTERACIVLFQNGGASQLDTYDPKPDAPADIKGSFGSIPTAIPGVHFSALLPRSAKILNRFAVIRSMNSDEAIHERARQYIFSGTKPRNDLLQPSYGAVMAKERGPLNGLPPFVVIPEKDLGAEAGFLGPSYDPFVRRQSECEDFFLEVSHVTVGGLFGGSGRSQRAADKTRPRFSRGAKLAAARQHG